MCTYLRESSSCVYAAWSGGMIEMGFSPNWWRFSGLAFLPPTSGFQPGLSIRIVRKLK